MGTKEIAQITREVIEDGAEIIKKALALKAASLNDYDWSLLHNNIKDKCFVFGHDHGGEYYEQRSVALFPDGSIKVVALGGWKEVSPDEYLQYGKVVESALNRFLIEGVVVKEDLRLYIPQSTPRVV